MSSSQSKNMSIRQTYHIPQTFLDAFMVFWIFLVSENYLSSQEKKAIKSLYSSILSVRSTNSVDYNPLVTTYRDLKYKLKEIKVTKKPTKIVVDSINAEYLLESLCSESIQLSPDEVYILAPSGSQKYQSLRLVQKHRGINIFIVQKISQVRETAQKSIRKWINKFQLFRNMFPLEKNTFQAAFERRVKLYACNNLDPLKYTQYLQLFLKYVCQQISLSTSSELGQKMDNSQRTTIRNSLNKGIQIKYEIFNMNKEIQRLKNMQKQSPSGEDSQNNMNISKLQNQISQNYDQFTLIMLSLYKGKTFFYEIINRGLKKMQQKQFQWQRIALPICFLHDAILYNYKNNSKKLIEQIEQTKQYILWRGGKITLDEEQQIRNKYEKDPFYEFLSFTSTSKSKDTALSFLSETQSQLNKVNCLFKYIIKRPKLQNNEIIDRYLMQSYCQILNNDGQKEDQVILNCLTVGKIISIEKQKDTSKKHSKIPVISIQIGSFEEFFYTNNGDKDSKLFQQKTAFKELTKHFKNTIQLVMKFQQFQFAAAYELCNQMQKSYNYLQNQIQLLAKECDYIGENNKNEELSHKRLSFFYSQQNYYSQLAEISRKMGNLTQASIHAENAINKYKQLQNIDKNRSFCLHQEKLKEMYLKCSQILIEKHDFRRARQIINEKIADLEKEENLTQRERNRVIISRMKLDLGVVNFKQGRLSEAKEKFNQSAKDVQKIFKSINYEDLKQETFFKDWIVALANDPSVKFLDGYQLYFQMRRKKQIQEATRIYGSQDRLLHLNRSAHFLENQTTQVISKHKEYFSSPQQYEEIINDIKKKVEDKMQINIPQNKQPPKTSKISQQPSKIRDQKKKQQGSRMMNKYKKIKQKIDDELVMKQKLRLNDIQEQQKQIIAQKEVIEQMLCQFWQNPDVYFQSSYDFKQQFTENFINKQKQNRQTLLKNSDEVSMQQLTAYYKKSADSIEKYIKDLEYWGYSQSAPKVLQQYNNMIKLYIEIDCNSDAQKKIAEVKKMALVKKEEKYFQLAVAYFLSGKIYQNNAQRDFIILEERDKQAKNIKNSFKQRLEKASKALQQFKQSEEYFQKSLISFSQQNGTEIQIRQAYESQPQQIQLKIWRMKSLLVRVQLQTNFDNIQRTLQKDILDLKNTIREGLKKIKTSNVDELEAEYKQTSALFNFFRGKYSQCKKQFDQCLQLRSKKFGLCNWQNTLTMLKIINYFQYSQILKLKLLQYKDKIEDSYVRFKNYPFFWKISLANYYLNKDCQKDITNCLKVIDYLQNCLKYMEKIGFAEKSFYDQYCLIYDQEYHQFYNYAAPFLLNRPRITKCQRKKTIRISKTTKKIEPQNVFDLKNINNHNQQIKLDLIKLPNPPQLDKKQSSHIKQSPDRSNKINKFTQQSFPSPNKLAYQRSQISTKNLDNEQKIRRQFFDQICANSKNLFESTQASSTNNTSGKYSSYLMASKNSRPFSNSKPTRNNSINYQTSSYNNSKKGNISSFNSAYSNKGNNSSLDKARHESIYSNKNSQEKQMNKKNQKQICLRQTLLQNFNKISQRQINKNNNLFMIKQYINPDIPQSEDLFAKGGQSKCWMITPISVYTNKRGQKQTKN